MKSQQELGMTEEQARKPWYVADILFFGGFALAYAGFFATASLTSYLDGASNGKYGLLDLLLPLGLGSVLLIWFAALPVWMLLRWPRRIRNWRRLVPLYLFVSAGLAVWIALPFVGLWPPGYKTFTHGLRRHMRVNMDLAAVRDWLDTLDAAICTGEPIEVYRATELKSRWPDTIAWPAAIGRFEPHYVQLMITATGQPGIRLTWGGALAHWGVEIGPEGMEIPPTQERRGEEFGPPGRRYMVYDPGEYRLPLAPGAYVWHEIQ